MAPNSGSIGSHVTAIIVTETHQLVLNLRKVLIMNAVGLDGKLYHGKLYYGPVLTLTFNMNLIYLGSRVT